MAIKVDTLLYGTMGCQVSKGEIQNLENNFRAHFVVHIDIFRQLQFLKDFIL